MENRQLTIGMFGFGNVGRGLYDVLNTISSKEASIKRICVRDITKKRGVEADFTDKADDIFNDSEINLIVELIDDAEAAYHIIKRALESGRSAVSGNKKMLAHHLPELIELQQKHNVALLYDASACGSIPVICRPPPPLPSPPPRPPWPSRWGITPTRKIRDTTSPLTTRDTFAFPARLLSS